VAKDPAVKAAVLISGKPDNFIAGADIRFIDTVSDFSSLKDGAYAPFLVALDLQLPFLV
jgi:enoyl-CoA hydratase/carnithine racemase